MKAITYDDILMVPSYNHWESRKVVDISMRCKTGKLFLDLPLMTANMDTITEADMANFIGSKGGIGVLHRYLSIEENVSMFKDCKYPVFVSIGCSEKDLQRAEALRDAGAEFLCVDVAHAHAKYVGRTLKCIREMIGDKACIMAGNVATYAGADYLASCSADIVKVGIGGGSVCTTRIKTGFGVPNLTAMIQALSPIISRIHLRVRPTYLAWAWATSTQKNSAPASRKASARCRSFSAQPMDTKTGYLQSLNMRTLSSMDI